jgi:hypothetical protein
MLVSAMAQATTVCSVVAGNAKEQVYDHILWSGDMTQDHYVVVDKNAKSAREVKFDNLASAAALKALNGQTLISFSKGENGGYSITAGTVDTSKSENVFPISAMAFGGVSKTQVLDLLLPPKGLSLVCSEY